VAPRFHFPSDYPPRSSAPPQTCLSSHPAVLALFPIPYSLFPAIHGCLSFGRTTAPVERRPLERFWFVELPKGAVMRFTVSGDRVGRPSTRSSSFTHSWVGRERRIFSWII